MSAIKTSFGSGGSGLATPDADGVGLAGVLRDVADDLADVRTALNAGIGNLDVAAADPAAVSEGALGAYTDPPSAGEMASTRALVNELRTTTIALRTLALEVKNDLNAAVAGTITSADPAAVSGGALAAFTDPPSAGEMAATRALVNEIRVTAIALRTLAIELKTDINAATFGTVGTLRTTKA